ncbi:MAG: CDGSH iron-sulfur domain-containing protein [Sedimenticola sp.]
MSEDPVIAQKTPYAAEVEKGKDYYWCSCGRSNKQPFCDGSHHEVEGCTPVAFVAGKTGTVYLCGCKRTKNKPYCDGSHNDL